MHSGGQLGDYGHPGSVNKNKAKELVEQTKDFMSTIKEYLRKEGYMV